MKILRLAVRDLRQFTAPFELGSLDSGLNLISGANETGKSALVRALQAVFFERYSTRSVDDLRPWQDANAAPEVEVEFEHAGQQYRLTKRFLRKAQCYLRVGHDTLEGDQAEGVLQQLLGFSYPGKGASKEEHWGIPGLLWITQGTGQELCRPISHAHGFLRESLSRGLEDLATSGGDALIDDIAAERSTLLTQTGKPTGALRKVAAEVEEAAEALQETDRKLGVYQNAIDRLAAVRREWKEYESTRPWEEAERKQVRAREQLQQVNAKREELGRNEAELGHKLSERQSLLERLGQWQEEREQLAVRAKRLVTLKARLEETQVQAAALKAEVVQAERRRRDAEALVTQAESRRRRQELELALQEGQLALEHARTQVARAHEALEQRTQLEQWLAGETLDADRVAALAQAEEAARLDAVRRETMATRVQYRLNPGRSISFGQQALSGSGELLVTEPTSVTLGDVGEILIEPGGEDLGAVAARARDSEQAYRHLLAEARVASVTEARRRLTERQEAEHKLAWLDRTLMQTAPDGLQALVTESENRAQRLAAAKAELDRLTASQGECQSEVMSAGDARDVLETAREELARVESDRLKARDDDVAARTALAGAEHEYQELAKRVDAEQRQNAQKAGRDRLLQLAAEIESLEQALGSQRAAIDAANPQLLEDDIKRYTGAADNLRAAQRERRTEMARLEGALEADGAAGLGEQRAEQAARLERLQRRHEALGVRAGALDLLAQRLQEKRNQLVERLQAPLQKHVAGYLRLLFPDAELTINEAFQPGKLLRNGLPDMDFEALSFGAREQVGVILRLAYADALKEAGRPTLIVLDDALVHSDRPRREAMQRVLYSAARRHQLLLFTCHPDSWADLGVPVRPLEQLKAEAGL